MIRIKRVEHGISGYRLNLLSTFTFYLDCSELNCLNDIKALREELKLEETVQISSFPLFGKIILRISIYHSDEERQDAKNIIQNILTNETYQIIYLEENNWKRFLAQMILENFELNI
jgi:hypothetical protein